jgi:selenocysteine lyase/cysteine desulfurase
VSPFGRRSKNTSPPAGAASAGASQRYGFGYLAPSDVYLDSACQTLRPQPVIDAMNEYFLTYNACGERVKYAWGIKVDDRVEATRAHVLKTLGLSSKQYTTCFTLNTTYALNLLLTQLPAGRYARILTTHTEHNSVFLPTMAFAQRCGVPRLVMSRSDDGALQYSPQDLANAVVVISAMNNVDGTPTVGLAELISETHKGGGIVIVDAAQAVPHALDMVRGLSADAVCFSAHKVYGASLGVVAAKNDLLASLTPGFIGGGMVGTVSEESFCLLDDLHSRLEPGLQAWGEIIALDTALTWLEGYSKGAGEDLHTRERRLSQSLYDGILEAGNATILGQRGSSLVTIVPTRVDGHQLAGFLSKAGIMVRSGYFCAHHWLKDVLQTGPAVRFSLGAHNTDDDIARTLEVTQRLLKGL